MRMVGAAAIGRYDPETAFLAVGKINVAKAQWSDGGKLRSYGKNGAVKYCRHCESVIGMMPARRSHVKCRD